MSADDGWSRPGTLGAGVALIAAGAAGATAPVAARADAGTFFGVPGDGIVAFKGIRYGRAERFPASVAEPRARDVLAFASGRSLRNRESTPRSQKTAST